MPKRKITVPSTKTAGRGVRKATGKKASTGARSRNAAATAARPIRSQHPISDSGHNQAVKSANTGFATIELRVHKGSPIRFQSSYELQRAAMQWSYVLRNRRRWNTSDLTVDEQSQRAQKQLEKIGLTKGQLHRLAEFELVEVSIPFVSEKEGWEGRIFPWEYMLSAATRSFRDRRPLIVIRHLERQQSAPPPRKAKKSRVLIVESAPAGLREQYNFESERDLVKVGLALPGHEISEDETRDKLRDRIATYDPDVIHLAGFDNNQAAALDVISRSEVFDGYLMKGSPDGVDPVRAEDLARILNAGKHKPALVACNFFYSAQRIGALAVAEGARAAIGFQDEFDDALTELFFCNFYDAWRRLNWDTLEAFKFACDALKNQPAGLTGTGVVLWSDQSLIKAQSQASRNITTTLLSDKEKVLTLKDLPAQDLRKLLSIEVKTCANLNYAMLHNNCELFEKFILRKDKTGCIKDIRIDVVLYVGGESSRYSCSVDMTDSPLDLNKLIRVPLIYSIDLLNNENVHTGLFVEVSWADQLLHRQTYRVTLPPLDEWRGDDLQRVWLPSFILPRDPAISRIVDSGQNYVMSLRDDSRAGFDGYQCIDPQAENPVECVDLQVRALWSALSYNMSISYINPPPTYNITAQRLRTPSEIVEGRRGTCIDLALLFAACLEYIDIYPVIFLFRNHALPGFWRSSAYQDDFRKVAERFQTPTATTGTEPSELSTVQRWPWYHSRNAYEEIMEEVDNNRLYPIETVGLTQHGGYKDSIEKGKSKLENKANLEILTFEGMIDVIQARNSLITPIPRR